MARHYRALISVPIVADEDDDAMTIATEYAHSLVHPGGGNVVAGHLELLGEVPEGSMELARVVWAEPAFRQQHPGQEP